MAKEKLSMNWLAFCVNLIKTHPFTNYVWAKSRYRVICSSLFHDGGTHVCSFILRLNLNVSYYLHQLLLVQGKWKQASAIAGGVLQAYQQREGIDTHRWSVLPGTRGMKLMHTYAHRVNHVSQSWLSWGFGVCFACAFLISSVASSSHAELHS